DAFARSELATRVFPKRIVSEYLDMKYAEWDSYHHTVTDWERERYLFEL
ncbi:MAG: glutamine synthetase, partial [Mycobacterium sp.]|nr:glutamine synthetase [Mycobacterium sp.]